MAQAETVENYNRRDNIRLLGVKKMRDKTMKGFLRGRKIPKQ